MVMVNPRDAFLLQQINRRSGRHCSVTNGPVHSFRLKPGDDLLTGISNYVAEHKIMACHVVSCVGSLKRATLRLAKPKVKGKERIIARDESFEIVGVTGTVEFNEAENKVTGHLHISLADENGVVWGGHMLSSSDGHKDCGTKTEEESRKTGDSTQSGLYPIYTTAEIGLLVDYEVKFSREHCEMSGWPELVVRDAAQGG